MLFDIWPTRVSSLFNEVDCPIQIASCTVKRVIALRADLVLVCHHAEKQPPFAWGCGSHFHSYGFAPWLPQSFLSSRTRGASVDGQRCRRELGPSPAYRRCASCTGSKALCLALIQCFDLPLW